MQVWTVNSRTKYVIPNKFKVFFRPLENQQVLQKHHHQPTPNHIPPKKLPVRVMPPMKSPRIAAMFSMLAPASGVCTKDPMEVPRSGGGPLRGAMERAVEVYDGARCTSIYNGWRGPTCANLNDVIQGTHGSQTHQGMKCCHRLWQSNRTHLCHQTKPWHAMNLVIGS